MTRKHEVLLLLAITHFGVSGCYFTCERSRPQGKSNYEDAPYYKEALLSIEQRRQLSSNGSSIGRFRAGWARRSITPPVGTPLAGYGGRRGKRSEGVHDELFVKALAVCDGLDTTVIVGADMLIIPENIAELVRADVLERTDLTANEILFNASHTHSGPGAFAPGLASMVVNGPYDRKVCRLLVRVFTEAIVQAYRSLEPAKVMHGGVDAPEYIRNRTRRTAPVDSELSYMLIEQADGDRCLVVSYSAHPTVLGAVNMQFSGDYCGFLMRRLAEETGAEAMFLGGAVGSMGPRPPIAANDYDRCRAMGEALADKILEAVADDKPSADRVEVASIGFPIEFPRSDVRLSKHWRLSRLLFPLFGIDSDGWMHAVRIGDVALVGMPADYCGEISADLKSQARERSIDLWVLSFNGDYVGYISPDKYYYDLDEEGGYGYERGIMSWIGPNQEALTTSLTNHVIDALFGDSCEDSQKSLQRQAPAE